MNRKYMKFFTLFAVIVLLAVLIPQHQAKAGLISDTVNWLGGKVFDATLGNLLHNASLFILTLVGSATTWAAELLDTWIKNQPITGVSVVEESWGQIRNFVNLLFILVLIIMAFGTIFDIKKYTWRDMLAPFLIAALLINFSLVIGQYVAGVSNGLSSVFLKNIGSVSSVFGQGGELGKMVNPALAAFDNGSDLLVTAVFGIVLMVIFFLALLSTAIFVMVRTIVIWFLLIISPIAWFGYVLPNLRAKTWSKWWELFLCWCFFLPFFLFFLMFAVMFISRRGEIVAKVTSAHYGSAFSNSLTATDFFIYTLSLIFLIGGLAMAKRLACASGTGVKAVFGRIESGVRKYAPGAAYVRGAKEGIKERAAEIAEKGILGIGGAQKERLRTAEAKGWIAGIPGPGRVPGAREEGARVAMAEIEKESKRIREQLLRLPADQQRAFLEAEKSKSGIAAQAAMLEFAKQGYATLKDYQDTARKFGGENSIFMRQYLENIKQAKLSDLFKSPDEELRIARGEVAGTEDLAKLRQELYKDLARRNQINNLGDYKEAKELLSPIPAELKSFLDSIKPEYIVGTREARQEAIRNRILDDPDLERKLIEFMKDKKEINDVLLRQEALAIVGGKGTIEGRNIINEVNKFNPIVNIEADLREERGNLTGPLDEASQNRIVREISDKISGMESGDIRKMSKDFFKNPMAQEAFRQTFDGEEISELLKNAPKEMRRALKDLASGIGIPSQQPTVTQPPPTITGRSEEVQKSREEILKELGKIP